MKRHNQEKGVVLLTCLVFLLVLLGMLRFTLTSAKVEEQKTGIDLEITSAREAAQGALGEVEKQILILGRTHCNALKATNATKYGNTDCDAEASKFANSLLRDDAQLGTVMFDNQAVFNNGLYVPKSNTNHNGQITTDKTCTPFYRCVDWSVNSAGINRSIVSKTFKSVECKSCNTLHDTTIKPRYIIERFKISDLDDTTKDKNTLVLRVTALGFGKGNNQENVTTSLLQATYLLPGDED